jgi:hypothetical protein
MYHYLICCKLTFDLQRNNKLHILNLHYYTLIFQIFLKFYFETKFLYLYAQFFCVLYISLHFQK